MTEVLDSVTLICDTPVIQPDGSMAPCGYEAVGSAIGGPGQMTAVARMGQHRYNKHGQRAKRGAKATPTAPPRTPLSIVTTAAGEMRTPSKGKPTADKLTDGLGELLALSTIGMASFLAETDPNIAPGSPGEQDRDDVVGYLSLPLEAAKDVMRPLATALAPTKMNAKYGAHVVNNVAALGSFVDLGRLFMHYRHYMVTRRTTSNVGAAGTPFGIAAEGVSVPVGPPPSSGGDEPAGHVWSAEDVQRLRMTGGH